jgi:hypothetical protein
MLLRRPCYFLLFAIFLTTALSITGCDKGDDSYKDPLPFPELPEDNNGSRTRSVTYVHDRRATNPGHPPQIDSCVFLFSYDAAGKVDRIRWTPNSLIVYDFSFERVGNKLTAIHCKYWFPYPNPQISQVDLVLEYNASGNVSLMRIPVPDRPSDTDSFIIKSTGARIDTVNDRTFSIGTNTDKYAFTYNASGDITQMDHIATLGSFYTILESYKYTLSASPAALILGNEAIYWSFFAQRIDLSNLSPFMIPTIFFHSAKQPSKLVLQSAGFPTGTYNYQTEYYNTGRPKKMTTDVITQAGAFYAREAYYYTYAQ